MYDHNQFEVPPSFVALYVPPGRTKPTETREFISTRYDLCEDLANHLCGYARAQLHDLGVAEQDVLQRCHRGLLGEASVVSAAEAVWVVRRLAELQDWEWPQGVLED